MMNLPPWKPMRRATRRELLFRLAFGYWPTSYVNALLRHANAMNRRDHAAWSLGQQEGRQ